MNINIKEIYIYILKRKKKKEKRKSGYLLSIPPRLLSGTSLIMVVLKKEKF
jgi:hypothetical protein